MLRLRSQVRSLGTEPNIFQRPPSAKSQLDIVRMRYLSVQLLYIYHTKIEGSLINERRIHQNWCSTNFNHHLSRSKYQPIYMQGNFHVLHILVRSSVINILYCQKGHNDISYIISLNSYQLIFIHHRIM